MALQLNVDFSDANEIGGTAPYHLGDLLLRDLANTPTYSGQTVRSFLASANRSLGGEPTVELLDEITQPKEIKDARTGSGSRRGRRARLD